MLLGIMASDARMAVRALRDWCQELEIDYILPENKVRVGARGSIYVIHPARE